MHTLYLLDEFNRMRQEMDRLLSGVENPPYSHYSFLPGRSARSYPLLNVHDDGNAYQVEALAPGLDPENLKISVQADQLVITGEKKAYTNGIKREAFHRQERATGKFVRTLHFGSDVDAGKVSATYSNGVLIIHLPKSESAKPKLVNVQIA